MDASVNSKVQFNLFPEDDSIKCPSHYSRYAIQPITFIMENKLEFWRGNIIKYTMRAGHKKSGDKPMWEAEIEDLNKIKRYVEMRINHIEGRECHE
tara:strand:- start:2704 stop:2991 length:288 start_codon:yes stop_codon:yes gene_type:complete